MCESGGNFEAVNPSSGAGGAYQILPSTWELYGGEGDPAGRLPERAVGHRRSDLGGLRRGGLGVRRVARPEPSGSALGRLALGDQRSRASSVSTAKTPPATLSWLPKRNQTRRTTNRPM